MSADPVVAAYSATGGSWQQGPGRIYDRLAEVVVAQSARPLSGARVLDAGAGTGAASRAALAAGASTVVAADAALGMLTHDAASRPPAVVGDLLAQPFAAASFDVAVAAFSLNHLADPAAGLRELARVTCTGGVVLGAVYSEDDTHPVKSAVEAALRSQGWIPTPWELDLKANLVPLLATAERCASVLDAAGLDGEVALLRVGFPDLTPEDLVAWRIGMAQHAPFFNALDDTVREQVVADALAAFEGAAALERPILVFQAITR